MNKVIITGRLGRDVEVKVLNDTTKVGNFSVAVDVGYGDKKKTSWINCTAWNKTAEIMNQYLTKGSQVLLEGEWCQESWTTEDGSKRTKDFLTVRNFEFMGGKAEGAEGTQSASQPEPKTAPATPAKEEIPVVAMDDEEIPF